MVYEDNETWQQCIRLMGHGHEIPPFFHEWVPSSSHPTTRHLKVPKCEIFDRSETSTSYRKNATICTFNYAWSSLNETKSQFSRSNSYIPMNLSLVAMSLIPCLTVWTFCIVQAIYKVKGSSCMRRKIQNMNLSINLFWREEGKFLMHYFHISGLEMRIT
jgi:hypothetical protein